MKTKTINSIGILLRTGSICLMVLGFVIISGCKKEMPEPPPPLPTAYNNMNDDSTQAIIATIPRIELSKLKSTEITIYLSITDQDGHPFKDFNQYNFVIKQVCVGNTDTTLVASISFNKQNVEGKNIITPLTLDYSGSMSGYTATMENAVIDFIEQKKPDDEIEVIKFSNSPEVVQTFTNDTSVLKQKVSAYWSGSGGSTAFVSAIDVGLDDANLFLRNNAGAYFPSIIGFTDGNDNNSWPLTFDSIINKSMANQIPVYTLGFGGANTNVLSDLANMTGGRYYYAPDISQLAGLYTLISGQLKNVYEVSWVYDNPNCTEVLIVVEANYTCKNGQFFSRVEKIFYPLNK